MADSQIISCTEACTVTVVHELSIPPFQLSPLEGAQIASAILAVWAVGFGFRAVIQALHSGGNPSSESES